MASLLALLTAGVTAFVDVRVVPMDAERVLEGATVLVRDGRIEAVGDATVPEGARVIDGRGLWLLPGLADTHVHNWYEEEHLLFLARGVTTVRNCWAGAMHLPWKRAIEAGTRLGPTLHTTSVLVDGPEPTWRESFVVATPEEARRRVRAIGAEGYPSVKVYDRLAPEVYAALVAEAHARGLRVAGHVPDAVGIRGVLAARQDSIEHLDGYLALPFEIDPAEIAALARQTAEAGCWNCPTLVAYRKIVPPDETQRLRARPEMRFVPPRLRATWRPERDFRIGAMTEKQFATLRRGDAARLEIVKALHDAGARLLLGTDCGNPFVVAGWSAHEELALLVEAGLTPYEALRCATARAAEYLGDDAGIVAPGRRADLLLVEGNPLEDVAHAGRIVGVMARGHWLPATELQRRLEGLAASYDVPRDRFRGMGDLPEGMCYHYEVTWNDLVVGEERFSITPDGTIHVQQANDPPWGSVSQARIEPGRLRRAVFAADWVVNARNFESMDVGVVRDFPWPGATLRARREPDEEGGRVYTLWVMSARGNERSRLVLDPEGVPREWAQAHQQGRVRFVRTSGR